MDVSIIHSCHIHMQLERSFWWNLLKHVNIVCNSHCVLSFFSVLAYDLSLLCIESFFCQFVPSRANRILLEKMCPLHWKVSD